jgi:RNase H-fold protein (predicted Holliday junction resolvase)
MRVLGVDPGLTRCGIGVVEKVGLRVTTVRDGQGTLWYLRNGEILKVGNQSQSG